MRTIASCTLSRYGVTRPNRVTPVSVKISLSANTEVQAGMPVAPVMRSHRRSSAPNPSQPDEVPFHPITSSLACASSSAARRISLSSNWPSACAVSAISVTRKRPKCALASGNPAIIRDVTGSSVVFDDGVNIPRRMRLIMISKIPQPKDTRGSQSARSGNTHSRTTSNSIMNRNGSVPTITSVISPSLRIP